jgi:hypothetical protein
LADELLVNYGRVLLIRNPACNVEIIAVGDVTNGKLLDESGHRSDLTPVCHARTSKQCYGIEGVGGCLSGAASKSANPFAALNQLPNRTTTLARLETPGSRFAQVSRLAPVVARAVFRY